MRSKPLVVILAENGARRLLVSNEQVTRELLLVEEDLVVVPQDSAQCVQRLKEFLRPAVEPVIECRCEVRRRSRVPSLSGQTAPSIVGLGTGIEIVARAVRRAARPDQKFRTLECELPILDQQILSDGRVLAVGE